MKSRTIVKLLTAPIFLMLLFGDSPSVVSAQKNDSTILASRIIDHEVYDKAHENIGSTDDIVIRRSGRVSTLTVGIGGLLGIGEKVVGIPFNNVNLEDGRIILEETEEQVEQRSEFDYLAHRLYTEYYYKVNPYFYEPRTYPEPYPGARGYEYYGPRARYEGPPYPYDWAFSPPRYLATVVMNRRLINELGQDIGNVKDLLINLDKSQVEKIIISSMEILGEDVHVALPYKPIGFTGHGLVYDIGPEQLEDFVFPYEE